MMPPEQIIKQTCLALGYGLALTIGQTPPEEREAMTTLAFDELMGLAAKLRPDSADRVVHMIEPKIEAMVERIVEANRPPGVMDPRYAEMEAEAAKGFDALVAEQAKGCPPTPGVPLVKQSRTRTRKKASKV